MIKLWIRACINVFRDITIALPEWSKGAHLRCAVATRRVGSNPTGGKIKFYLTNFYIPIVARYMRMRDNI